jgi:hypothetical protein
VCAASLLAAGRAIQPLKPGADQTGRGGRRGQDKSSLSRNMLISDDDDESDRLLCATGRNNEMQSSGEAAAGATETCWAPGDS